MGWLLLPAFEGRGYAAEAARAARGYAYGTLGWKTAVSYVSAENHRSAALARRLGAREDLDAPSPGDGLVFRHPAPEAPA